MPGMADLTHEYFEQLMGRAFKVVVEDQTLELKVQEVVMLPPPRRRTVSGRTVDMETKRKPFSILFRSEGPIGLRQGSYPMQPPEGDAMLIFVVPLGVEDGGVVYEAIFT